LIAMGVEQRGSAASLRILERQDQREVNGETPEQNLTCLQHLLPFKDSSWSLLRNGLFDRLT
jgi:hypothetical protein